MNILLTGHKGFIGSNLLVFLQSQGHQVSTLDKSLGFDILNCDFPHNVELVIHLAGLSGVRDSLTRPTEYWKTNVIGTQRLFEFYRDKRIVYASSSTAHEPWKNPYAMSKYSMEQLEHKDSLGLRFTTVYGVGARENMLIPLILKNKVHYLNVNHVRDFIHVDDVISVNLWFMNNNKSGLFNVGTGVASSFNKVANLICSKNSKLKIRYIKFPNNLRNAYQPYTKANLKNLRNIGYKKDFISIKEGINRYLNEI